MQRNQSYFLFPQVMNRFFSYQQPQENLLITADLAVNNYHFTC
jgi:hypothetical protein